MMVCLLVSVSLYVEHGSAVFSFQSWLTEDDYLFTSLLLLLLLLPCNC